jgi:hypothetical protein
MGFAVREGLPTPRKLARSVNTSAFVGTNPADEPITSGVLARHTGVIVVRPS